MANLPDSGSFPNNSHISKERPKLEKVAKGKLSTSKNGMGKRIADSFVGDDMPSVRDYVIFEVVVPAVKTIIADAFTQGLERRLFGGSYNPRQTMHKAYTNYQSSVRKPYSPEQRRMTPKAKAQHDFREIILEDRTEAETILEKLVMLVDEYDVATVSDLYSLTGITGSFTDDKWGWTNLRTAGIKRIREGYLLTMPNPEPID